MSSRQTECALGHLRTTDQARGQGKDAAGDRRRWASKGAEEAAGADVGEVYSEVRLTL